ncbi:MAG: hypothetical protein B5M51_09820 [Anaerolinea sp. 4484_236]|nr:MAG: hypothetical protein B5M51_09820 [Anaerolinea sp. 4484_236]
MRDAIFQIWLKRDYTKYAAIKERDMSLSNWNPSDKMKLYVDYTKYAAIKERDMSLSNWNPSDKMKLYVRKDIAAQVWNYGTLGSDVADVMADPYEGKEITRSADQILNGGLFNKPRNAAIAPDGSIYVSDSDNHRILHLSAEGEILRRRIRNQLGTLRPRGNR